MKKTLQMKDILQKSFALSQEDAQKLYSPVESCILNNEEVILSFKDIENCSSIFLNNFLGKLYSNYGDKVELFLRYADIEDDILQNQLETLRKRALGADLYKPIFLNYIS